MQGSNNTIGGTTSAARNIISGNGSISLLIVSGASGNQVLGNYIGTNVAGTAALANNVGIEDAGTHNIIGGSVSGARNVISGNSNDGILLASSAGAETVQSNFLGLNASGNAALANGSNGMEVQGNNNIIGGASGVNYYTRNFFSGNTNDGLLIDSGATGNQVLGNFIGLGVSGTQGVGNLNGVEIGGSSNTIGSTAFGNTNYISGNKNDGVLIDSGATGNLILGADVGTDYTGKNAVGNRAEGIEVDGNNNTVGGTASAARNILSGNDRSGVLIGGSGTLVQGNYIGVNISGSALSTDGVHGIGILGTGNTIGGTTSGARNIISGNRLNGINLLSNASGNLVQGNFIGSDPTGASAVANDLGVLVQGTNNTIGGTTSGAANEISGNTTDGILLYSTASSNQVQGNYIGINHAGTGALANSIGIEAMGAGNTIGGSVSGARNVISGNSNDGVLLDSTASGTAVQGNVIGLNVSGNVPSGFTDHFESSTLDPFWNYQSITSGSITFPSTAQAHSGQQSIQFNSTQTTENKYIFLGHSFNQATYGTASVWVYDTGAGQSSSNYVQLSIVNHQLGETAYVNAWDYDLTLDNGGSYAFGTPTVSQTSSIARTQGWHQFSIDSEPNSLQIAIDGTTVYSGTDALPFDLVQMQTYGPNSRPAWTYYFDDFQFTPNAIVPNGGNGVEVQSANNTIGGTVYYARNFISGNQGNGVLIDSGATGNQVLGNFIGLGVDGTSKLGNGSDGVEIAGAGNTIGGTASGASNVISGNAGDGVNLNTGASGNLVQGNDVGTDYTGKNAVANSIGIEVTGVGNTIGGSVAGARNVISGNSSDGVKLDSSASGTVLLGNLIGINAINVALANGGNGLDVLSVNNTIGGTASGARNILSGNSKDGLLIASGASGNQVLGNFIGVNFYRTAALGNGTNGIEIAGNGNTVGGTATAALNIISGNTGDGVKIDSGASGNQVLGNYIGTNAGANGAIANAMGIEDAGSGNVIGSSVSGARNIISGNTGDGVLLDSTATGDAVWGNFLGLNATGNGALDNGKNGLEVQGTKNTVGGTVLAERNYITGNTNDGLLISSSASGNLVLDNFIGVDQSGTHGVANLNGIEIAGTGNTIGGTAAGSTNVISANKSDGILIDSSGSGNLVLGNNVGPDYTGNGAGVANSGNGIEVAGTGNTLGGTTSAAKNIISGNTGDGVKIDSTGTGNLLLGNYFGVNRSGAALGNSGNGVEIAGSNNTVGGSASGAGNIISDNSKNGVLVSAGSGDTISRNSIFGNALLGISLANGVNNIIVAPSLSSATISGSTLTVQGSFSAPTANVSYVLEFFANLSGDPEGRIYLGSLTVTPTNTGSQNFTFTTTTTVTGTYPLITATLTDNSGDTSQFSNGVTTS